MKRPPEIQHRVDSIMKEAALAADRDLELILGSVLEGATAQIDPPAGYEQQLMRSLRRRIRPAKPSIFVQIRELFVSPMVSWSLTGSFAVVLLVAFLNLRVQKPDQGTNDPLLAAMQVHSAEESRVLIAALEDSSAETAREIAAVSNLSEDALNGILTKLESELQRP